MQTKAKWNNEMLEEFIKLAKLNDFQKEILHLYCDGQFLYAIADKMNCCQRTISRELKKIEKKYDEVHRLYPDKFPDKYKYKTKYRNINGYLMAKNETINTKIVTFDGRVFDSLEDVRRYIIKTLESMSLEEFCDIGNVHMKLDLDFDIEVTKI